MRRYHFSPILYWQHSQAWTTYVVVWAVGNKALSFAGGGGVQIIHPCGEEGLVTPSITVHALILLLGSLGVRYIFLFAYEYVSNLL